MTGFGAGEAALEKGALQVELRALNHKHLEVRVRATVELADLAGVVEEVVRAQCTRGRIEATLRYCGGPAHGPSLDLDQIRGLYREVLALRDELSPGEPIPLSAVMALSAGARQRGTRASAAHERAARQATRSACDALAEMRRSEGIALAQDLASRLTTLVEHARWIEGQRERLVEEQRTRLTARIETLLENLDVRLDPGRLAHEVAWFAEKSDVTEELTRIRSHVQLFDSELRSERTAVGRKLDFLVQELGREVNTVGSKVADAQVAHRVVELKTELDRIREQLQNIL